MGTRERGARGRGVVVMALAGTPYLVGRRIGQGGMGEIYEAEHTELGRRAALKVLHRRHLGRADLAARLREEARLLARLPTPTWSRSSISA